MTDTHKEAAAMREFVTALGVIVLALIVGGIWYAVATYF